VILPFKEKAMRIVDYLNLVFERIGTVNIAFVNEDGSLSGINTDDIGPTENLKTGALEWKTIKPGCRFRHWVRRIGGCCRCSQSSPNKPYIIETPRSIFICRRTSICLRMRGS